VCWFCSCHPTCDFDWCLDSNPETCRRQQVCYQFSHPSALQWSLEFVFSFSKIYILDLEWGLANSFWDHVNQISFRLMSFQDIYKSLVACCHSFYLFLHYSRIHTIFYIYSNAHRLPLLNSSLLPLGRRPPLGCWAEIRTRACHTASRRATVWAMPHSNWATPLPSEPRRTQVWATPHPGYIFPVKTFFWKQIFLKIKSLFFVGQLYVSKMDFCIWYRVQLVLCRNTEWLITISFIFVPLCGMHIEHTVCTVANVHIDEKLYHGQKC